MGLLGDLLDDWAAPKCEKCSGPLKYDAEKSLKAYMDTTMSGGYAIWDDTINGPSKKFYRCKRCGNEVTRG